MSARSIGLYQLAGVLAVAMSALNWYFDSESSCNRFRSARRSFFDEWTSCDRAFAGYSEVGT